MKTLGEAAMDLPWLAPSVASMLTMARSPLPSVWNEVRSDPGIVLLSANLLSDPSNFCSLNHARILEAILEHEKHFQLGFVDWSRSGPDAVHRLCYRQALLSSQLAEKIGLGGPQAWIASFFAPISWLAVTALEGDKTTYQKKNVQALNDVAAWQRQTWGHDHTALARRMCRAWRLPGWLTAVVANLGLPVEVARKLGAEPRLFQVVQLAVLSMQSRERGFGLPVGAEIGDLLKALHLGPNEAVALTEAAFSAEPPARSWESPGKHPLLPELLRLALENRRQNDAAWVARLHQDLDQLQEALVEQCAGEKARLHTMKLSSLAEFAAGAGHEINNPLAVISGQAQYVLKQMDWLNVPAEEIENVAEYLGNLRTKITPSLQKIIGQTQRIHSILTELMQFARPSPPNAQTISVRDLVEEVSATLASFALEHEVRLNLPDGSMDEFMQADPGQMRVALGGLLRNAIEAAPAGGWAAIRMENRDPGVIDLIVEDNGGGPGPNVREHLFDPFYSGRSAGRGRGMGLPTAWRLARQQGGDVRFDGHRAGVTRFILTLPRVEPTPLAVESNGRNGSHALVESN
jgi:two-component system, NtrC family, sensor kinase